jgi:hypothetical protein
MPEVRRGVFLHVRGVCAAVRGRAEADGRRLCVWCGDEQQSLAFSASVPAFVYQNVFFEAAVGLVDDHRARITGCVLLTVATRSGP